MVQKVSKLPLSFYQRDTLVVARELLGKIMVRKYGNEIMRARIVEVEAYMGAEDRACHTFQGKRTVRNDMLYAEGGHVYVYLTYGIHCMLNFVTDKKNVGQGVLIRGVEPLSNLDLFAKNRFNRSFGECSTYQKKNLTNGPGKLTQALKIDMIHNGASLIGPDLYLEDGLGAETDETIVSAKRIGIDYAEEARDYLYRFYLKDNPWVSIIE